MIRYRHTPALSFVQLTHAWQLYLQNPATDAQLHRASPGLLSNRGLEQLGRVHIIGAEVDVLRDEVSIRHTSYALQSSIPVGTATPSTTAAANRERHSWTGYEKKEETQRTPCTQVSHMDFSETRDTRVGLRLWSKLRQSFGRRAQLADAAVKRFNPIPLSSASAR
jgi:hypothetical protein